MQGGRARDDGDFVAEVGECRLRVTAEPWSYAVARSGEIARHWQARSAANPVFFNGRIYLCYGLEVAGSRLDAAFHATDFASYLYWREQGFEDRSVCDAFGSGLVRSAEGHLILGIQNVGNVNAGRACTPGGFIDARDVAADGTIDIDASIAREIGEETGLAAAGLVREPGYVVIRTGAQVSIGAGYRSAASARELCDDITAHIQREAEPEWASVVAASSPADADRYGALGHVRILLSRLYGG